ncbi:Tetratricopeptide (TPR) repeat, partial [Candidatus Methanophagaceae archaeon]
EKPSGVWNTLKLCALCDLRVDKSLVFSIVPSVAGETSPSYLDFPESYKFALSDTIFIDDEKKANDPERIFRPKEEEEPSGWSIRENVGWGRPGEIKDKLKTRQLTNYSEIQSCFVNTNKTQEFLDLVSKEYAKPYYLISPANTGKSTLLNVASWEIFKNMNGIRSYVILIDKKIPTYDELIEHLRKYYYVEDENFICIFDRMEHIPTNIPDPEPLKELIRSLRNNHHIVWGAGRTWDEFQFTETWKKSIEENFEIHKLPELLKGTDVEKFRPKFEEFSSDEKEMSEFWKLVLEEDKIESDSFSQLYVALQRKEMKLADDEVKSIVKDNLKRTSSRYDKIYRTLNSWEHNIYCLAYKFQGIFKDIANNIISAFENEEMDYIDQMAKEGKIEIGLHPIMKKEERWLGITGTHLNDESRRILEKRRTYDSIVNTCSSLLRTFFETDSEKACSSIPYFFSTRTVMSKTLLKAFVELVLRCRDEFMNFHILSYLARENPLLTEYWKELVQQKDNAPNEWLFGEVVINFGIAIAQSGENKAENKAFSDIVDLVPNGEQLHNLGVDLINLKMIDYALVAYDKAIGLDPKDAYPWHGKGAALSELGEQEEAIQAYDKAIELDPKLAYPWNGKGNALSVSGKQEEAIQAYDKAIELNPKFADPWSGKGILFWRSNKMEKAKQTFKEAIEIFPKNLSLRSNYSELLIVLDKLGDARKSIEKAIVLCFSQKERQDMEVIRITLIMIIEGYEKARKFVHSFINDFTLQNSHWDYSDIAPALSSLSEIDRKRIEAIQKLNLGRCSVDNVKALWGL